MRCRHHFRHRKHDLRLDLVQIYPLDRAVNWNHDYHCEHLCHLSICFQLSCGQYVNSGFVRNLLSNLADLNSLAYSKYASSALAGQSLVRNIAATAFPLFTNQASIGPICLSAFE